MGRIIFVLLLGVLLYALPCAVTAVDLVNIPMDAQINLGSGNAITCEGGAVSFQPAAPPDEPQGWARSIYPNFRGPDVNFLLATGGFVDTSDPNTMLHWDLRYVQGTPNGNAPITLVMEDKNYKWRNYGLIYSVPPNSPYPAWTHVTVPLNNTVLHGGPYGGDAGFDPSQIRLMQIYFTGAQYAGDIVDAKNLVISLAAPSPTLSGHVYGGAGTGNPLAGATVTVNGTTALTTDSSGFYTLSAPPTGSVTIAASLLGYATQTTTLTVNPGTSYTQDFNLSAVPTVHLSGHVYSGAGTTSPISGATVKVEGTITTTTNSAGFYTFAAVPTGSINVAVTATDYQPQAITKVTTAGQDATQDFHMVGIGALPVFIPMDHQINLGNGDAITSWGTLTFPHVEGDGEPGGWARSNFPGAWRGPNVSFAAAGVSPVNCSDTTTLMEMDLRYYQEVPAGAALVMVLQDTNGNWRNVGAIYSLQTGALPYPAWTHVAIPLNDNTLRPYHDDGPFDPGRVRLMQIYNTAGGNPGPQSDFVDAKNLLIRSFTSLPIRQIKGLPPHSAVDLWFMPVTYTPTSGGVPSDSYFYVEQPDRSAGIRILNLSGSLTPLAGSIVNLSGTLETDDTTGEPYLAAGTLSSASGVEIAPLGLNTRALHEDPKLAGELVRACGTVQEVDPDNGSNYQWFTVADGYAKGGAPVTTKVQLGTLFGDPALSGKIAVGDLVKFTGVVSQESPTQKVILLKSLSPVEQILPNPPHTITVGFENYALGEVVGQGSGAWTGDSGEAAVAASPDPAFGAKSLRLSAEGTVDFSTGLAGQTLKYCVVKMHIWRDSGTTAELHWWGNGTTFVDEGAAYVDGTQPIVWDGGGFYNIVGIGRFMEVTILWDFVKSQGSTWIDGTLRDNKVTMSAADTTIPDINFQFHDNLAGTGSIYIDDISFGYALDTDP